MVSKDIHLIRLQSHVPSSQRTYFTQTTTLSLLDISLLNLGILLLFLIACSFVVPVIGVRVEMGRSLVGEILPSMGVITLGRGESGSVIAPLLALEIVRKLSLGV